MLTRLLYDLERQWHRLQAPIASALRPGLSDSALDSLAERLGVTLPFELRELWSWHDGAEPDIRSNIGPGGYDFLTTDEVLTEHQLNLRVHGSPVDSAPELAEMYWHSSWVPFMQQGAQRLYIDCSRRRPTWPSPVRLVTWEWEDFEVDRAPSLAAAVSMWTWLLTSDYYRWDDQGRGHAVDYSSIPLFAKWTLA